MNGEQEECSVLDVGGKPIHARTKNPVDMQGSTEVGVHRGKRQGKKPVRQPGPIFMELLKHKILLRRTNPCLVKSDYRPGLH